MNMKMQLVRSLVWTVLTYGAECWTLTKAEEKRIESAEQWIYRRMLRVSRNGPVGPALAGPIIEPVIFIFFIFSIYFLPGFGRNNN